MNRDSHITFDQWFSNELINMARFFEYWKSQSGNINFPDVAYPGEFDEQYALFCNLLFEGKD